MPDVREKMVELLDEAEEWADHKCDVLDCETCPADKMKGNCVQQLMVDRLIANGVTIQQWIPVAERLPGNNIPSARYLCYAKGYVRILKYWRMYKSFEYGGKPVKVTHWMPLPEPPKEEE